MIRGIHKVSTLLVLASGVSQTVFSFFVFDSLGESTVWYAGTALCEIFIALLNMALWLPNVPALSRHSVAAGNFLFFFWLVAAVTIISGPIPLAVAGIGAAMVITAPLLVRRKTSEPKDRPNTPIQPNGASPGA